MTAPDCKPDPATGRLPNHYVGELHRLLAGDNRTETAVINFIQAKFGVRDLAQLPLPVASEILRRPADFLAAVNRLADAAEGKV